MEDILQLEPLYAVRYGIEILPDEVHDLLEDVHEKNTQFIRYMPDTVVIDKSDPKNTYLMEFKMADTGIKKWSFLNRVVNQRPEMPPDVLRPYPKKAGMVREDIFNVELTAHELYHDYEKLIDVAIVGYASFLARGLIANYNKNLEIVSYYTPGKIGRPAQYGSYTRIANIDQRSMLDFKDFMMKRHPKLDEEELEARIQTAEAKLGKLSKFDAPAPARD